MSPTTPTALREGKLSVWTKIAYAVGDFSNSMGPGTIVPFWYFYFLTDVARLDPVLAGLAVLIGGVWDAVNDPLMGMLSDRTRTRWGRRRPYLLFGAVPYGIMFALLWVVPPIQNQVHLCLYYALIYVVFDTASTVVSCPYFAMPAELTLDHDERTSIITYLMTMSILTGLLAAVGFAIVLDKTPDKQTAFLMMGAISATLFVPTILVTFFGTRERADFQDRPRLRPREVLRFVLRNREWWHVLAMRLTSWIPVDLASAVLVYYLIYWIGMKPMEASLVQAVILTSAALFLPLVLWMSNRWEKKTAFIVLIASWAVVMLSLFFLPEGARPLVYCVAFLTGPGIAAAHVMPFTMSADTFDVDELASGRRQEGVYSGFEVFIRKLSTKIVLATLGPVLAWSGYVENAARQSSQTLSAIRIMVAVVPTVLLIGSILIARSYKLTRVRHREVQAELERLRPLRKAGEAG